MKQILLLAFLFTINFSISQNTSIVKQTNSAWVAIMQGDNFDPNDDQQSNADQDFVGNANYALVETKKETTAFSDGITDDVYYFRTRMAEMNPLTSFYLGIDVSGDMIADVFVEANWKNKTPYVSFHQRDYSKTGLSPSQTAWLNGTRNGELQLTYRNAGIFNYAAGTDIDGAGPDSWLEFGFTEESIKAYVLNTFGIVINGDSAIALYGFTSTSQTSNGDIGGINDKEPGVLDKTWEELGIIINGTLNNITSGEILTPTVNKLTTEDTSPRITGTWGGTMLGDDSLTVTVNGYTYGVENGLVIDNTLWSLTILAPEFTEGTYEVVATTSRLSNSQSKSDTTSLELQVLAPPPTTVTSANDGGLESNGDLASLIANRNFKRIKTNNQLNKKQKQSKFSKKGIQRKSNESGINLATLFPESGLNTTETAHISTAEDLLNVTNAIQIFGVDYYVGNTDNRVAAVLATETTDKVYDHSKVICDRLNSSSLIDATVSMVKEHQIIMLQIERDNGLIEYALNFSIELLNTKNKLHSYWSIEQYPAGDYMNFQIWGSTKGQVHFIADKIISNLESATSVHLSSENLSNENRVPSVFVKKGFYKNGKLYLDIKNKSNDSSFYFEGNKRSTEKSYSEHISQNINLSGNVEEQIILETGNLFDIGFSIKGENSLQTDAIYLADGPWGIDYLTDDAKTIEFNVQQRSIDVNSTKYEIERKSSVKGNVKGVVNLFRNIIAGNLAFDAEKFGVLEFKTINNLPIEVVIVTEGLTDWNDRLRFQIEPNETEKKYNIAFKNFKNGKGNPIKINKIVGVVFSIIGDFNQFKAFNLEINEFAFLQDLDQDGIIDELDNCMNTPYGADINASGCFSLPFDNFNITAVGETCTDIKNGQLIISAKENYNYETIINGVNYNFSTEGITVSNLSPGVYNFCLNILGDFDLNEKVSSCYSIEILSGSVLTGKSSITSGKVSIDIGEGTAPYNVFVNGTSVLKTQSTSFDLDVNAGDKVEVKSDIACEGVFSKTIDATDLFTAYPNPTNGMFQISMPTTKEEVAIEIFNMNGQLISKQNYSNVYGSVQLNLENKPKGVYMAKLNLNKPVVIKIIKQ
ncbi:T9SS type A sorting domain-containing protein [uncultured Lutibacter sp.]|uniref:T9SS type A sorting domain-containing protein n=1 Tax=uncultured Lutibacter sp. TaxID=437739 RepID=UPI00261E3859|nr:T9SS type A sorting domain-containing protein [uncultured Lutibacter sp.]